MDRPLQLPRKSPYVNNILFPRALRSFIPDHDLSGGRVLKLDSVAAQAAHTAEWGKRVQIKLHVCETGQRTGAFDVWIDIESEAAKALAKLIEDAADQSDNLPPVRVWTRPT